MKRTWLGIALLVVAMFVLPSQTDARVVLGLGFTDGGAAYVNVSDHAAAHLEVVFSAKGTDMGAFVRQQGASYVGWLHEWQGLRLSFGGLVLTETDTAKSSPGTTMAHRQNVTPRASATVVLLPVRATVGVSSVGLDYFAGIELPVVESINIFAGYVSWPTYHSGVTAGITAHW